MSRHAWFWSVGGVLLLAAVVLAADGYVNSNGARLQDSKRPFGAKTVKPLKLNDKLEVLEGTVGKYGWVRAKATDGLVGYINGKTLREEPLEGDFSSVTANDRNYSQSVGAAAKGFNSTVENRVRKDDRKFDAALKRLEALIRLLDDELKKPTPESGRPSYFEALDAFHAGGDFTLAPFSDGPPPTDDDED